MGAQEEAGVHPEEEVGEEEGASCLQEGVAVGELGQGSQSLAGVVETGDHPADPG